MMSAREGASACQEYLDRLPLSREVKRLILDKVASEDDPARAMAAVHRALAGSRDTGANAALASVHRRLRLGYPSPDGSGIDGCIAVNAEGVPWLVTTPRLERTPMAPAGLVSLWAEALRTIRSLRAPGGARRRERPDPDLALRSAGETGRRWHGLGEARRILLFTLVLGQTAAAAYFMTAVLPYHGGEPLEVAILVLFAILFGWVSVAFWTGLVGFVMLLARKDRYAITRSLARVREIPPEARTAVIMPICDEDVKRVFAGLSACYTSLARTGWLERFDFFVLSDSGEPDARAAETVAWADLCSAVDGFGRVFYRWRRHRIKRKSGNVADFCRRWGRSYRYMVVLDADSVMSGSCLTALVRLMEANPSVGIVQTAPRAVGRDTLYARIQQFATRVYGPVLTAGLNFWQLGESYYWGHNAILRVAPFMRHCALGRLPGRGAFSGEILSHDFVEAALMRRAGWAVWMAYDLPGSYEEMPPNLIDELKRDRRWCRGNLINSRLFLAEGLHPAHRAVFMAGMMTYLSAPLWLLSLALSTAFVAVQTVIGPQYFVQPRQLFPVWPEWHAQWAIGLAAATMSVLFLPKILGMVLVLARGARKFGGAGRLTVSALLEMVFSSMLAPIRMAFHTQFVLAALTGWRTHWESPPRRDAETSWADALRRHGGHTLLGIVWALGMYRLDPPFLWWLLPVVGALALSIPVSVYSSRISLGRRCRDARLFLIPEETRPPLELRGVRRWLDHPGASEARLADAVTDPVANALACAAAARCRTPRPALRNGRHQLLAKAVRDGPRGLARHERMLLLGDAETLAQLHLDVWTSPSARAKWRAEAVRPAALPPVAPWSYPPAEKTLTPSSSTSILS